MSDDNNIVDFKQNLKQPIGQKNKVLDTLKMLEDKASKNSVRILSFVCVYEDENGNLRHQMVNWTNGDDVHPFELLGASHHLSKSIDELVGTLLK